MYVWEKIKENRTVIIIITVLLLLGCGYMLFFTEKEEILLLREEQKSDETNMAIVPIVENNVELEQIQKIIIDVKGAVYNPGVYELPIQSRVHEAITVAGGSLEDADVTKVNLAAFIKDGQVVYIPYIGEESSIWEPQISTIAVEGHIDNGLININMASLEELQKLPGIGPSKAQAIMAYRDEHGSFKDVGDLIHVSGIGQKTLDKLVPLITVR